MRVCTQISWLAATPTGVMIFLVTNHLTLACHPSVLVPRTALALLSASFPACSGFRTDACLPNTLFAASADVLGESSVPPLLVLVLSPLVLAGVLGTAPRSLGERRRLSIAACNIDGEAATRSARSSVLHAPTALSCQHNTRTAACLAISGIAQYVPSLGCPELPKHVASSPQGLTNGTQAPQGGIQKKQTSHNASLVQQQLTARQKLTAP